MCGACAGRKSHSHYETGFFFKLSITAYQLQLFEICSIASPHDMIDLQEHF